MANKNEFDFDDNMDDFSLESEPAAEGGGGGKTKGGKRAAPRQLLLLVLLLVVGAAAAFFLLGPSEPEAPAPAPAPVKKQPIAVPVKPVSPPVAVQPQAPAQPVAATVQQPNSRPAAQPVSQPARQVAPQVVATKPAPQPAAAVPKVAAPAAASLDTFYLAGGAFLYQGNLAKAERLVRQLGFEPKVISVLKPVKMTRLRVGLFPPAEAKAKVKELLVKYPGAFSINKGDHTAVYVGSFHDLDLGRFYADKLYLEGVHLDEEPVKVEMSVRLLTFGDFPDRAAAEAAAEKAKAIGLTTEILEHK